jgi:hypothetical protein
MLNLTALPTDKDRAYRRRLAEKGLRQVIMALPEETVAMIDELKQRHRLRSRSEVLQKLVERGRATAQQTS